MGLYSNRAFLALPTCPCHPAVGVFTLPQLVSLLLEANCARGLENTPLPITEKPLAPPSSTFTPLPTSLTNNRTASRSWEVFHPHHKGHCISIQNRGMFESV